MLVILEGQERTGKSTLTIELSKLFTKAGVMCNTLKLERADDPIIKMLEVFVPLALDERTVHFVDRGHITEYVYRTLDKTITSDYVADIQALDRILVRLGTKMIWLTAPSSVLEHRHDITGREKVGPISAVHSLFAGAFMAFKSEPHRFNSADHATDEIARAILELYLDGEL